MKNNQKQIDYIQEQINNLEENRGSLSDTHHTFDELYMHRAILFSVICSRFPELSWKSKQHAEDEMFDGMFIVGINTPLGQSTYHYDLELWDMFDIKELDKAPPYDGHTPEDTLTRLLSLKDCTNRKIKFIK